MPAVAADQLAATLGSGLLSFPITHFADDLTFDESAYRSNLGWLAGQGAAGLFAAGGTGEFFSLTLPEVEQVVAAAAAETPAELPVIAPAGYGTATAVELSWTAEGAGADGILLLPPYLTGPAQEGLAKPTSRRCAGRQDPWVSSSTTEPTRWYEAETLSNDLAASATPTLVGLKDGVGDIELMTRIYSRMDDRLVYIGGLPTAETFALPYLNLGLTTYSSAIFNFTAGVGAGVLRRRARGDTAGDGRARPSSSLPLQRPAEPNARIRGVDRQGGHERDRSPARVRCDRR